MIEAVEIEGMHCSSCARGIESFLQSQEGIENAKVNYEEKQLKIEYTEKADLDEAWDRIEEMGYEVKVE